MTWALLAGLSGLLVGTLLTVWIDKIPRRQSLRTPVSRCAACSRPLSWWEFVPVAGWLASGGRCRACHARMSPVYPLVEAMTGAVFAWAALHYGGGWLLVSRLIFACLLIALGFIDFRNRILPNVLTFPGIVVGLALSVVAPPGLLSSVIGLVIGGLVPLALAEAYARARKMEGMGMGDVKLLAMVGAFLGWESALLALAVGSILSSVVGIGLIVSRKGTLKTPLPFGTFLALAGWIAAVWGDPIITWLFPSSH